MSSHDPIAYTYEADHHCKACAFMRFDRNAYGDITGIDNEGNEIGAVFSLDEWHVCSEYLQDFPGPATMVCSTCGVIIEEHVCLEVN